MSSVVAICNRALDKLGQDPITSLTDGTVAANRCNRTWPIVRDAELREHPWNFAVKRATLSPSTTTPDWGFSYMHRLPTKNLRLIEVLDLSRGEYQVEGKYILANDDTVKIRYVEKVEDPNEYDSMFIETVATRMAFEMCEAFNQNRGKKQDLGEEYKDSLMMAKRADALENPPGESEEDDWISVRY